MVTDQWPSKAESSAEMAMEAMCQQEIL